MELPKVLLVDDEPLMIQSFERHLRGVFHVELAMSPQTALERIRDGYRYTVVIADLNMPSIDGINLLGQIKDMIPETVRVLMSSGGEDAARCVNEGQIFRIVRKPCSAENIENIIHESVAHFEAQNSLKIQLEHTNSGIIKLLTECAKAISPSIYASGRLNQERLRCLGRSLELNRTWDIELASILYVLGFISVPTEIQYKKRQKEEGVGSLSDDENRFFIDSSSFAAKLIQNIPRLKNTAESIRYMYKNYNGTGIPADDLKEKKIPIGGRILRILKGLIELESANKSAAEAFEIMSSYDHIYDPDLVQTFREAEQSRVAEANKKERTVEKFVQIEELQAGFITKGDIETVDGIVIIPEGTTLTPDLIEKAISYNKKIGLVQPVLIEGNFIV